MRYVMMICGPESNWDDTDGSLMDEVNTWWQRWHEAGKVVTGGAELAPTSTAKTIRRADDGQPTVTDGPYLELKEVVGGFIRIDADDMDDAIGVAATWPGIRFGDAVEVRPVMERDQ